jgi:hypothetical protein
VSLNVYDVSASRSERLTAKATDNLHICQNFMGLVGKCVVMADERNLSWDGVIIWRPTMAGNTIKAQIHFGLGGFLQKASMLDNVSDVRHYVNKESESMGRVVKSNPTFLNFLSALVDIADAYARDKGVPFSEVKIPKAFVDDNNVLVMELGLTQ